MRRHESRSTCSSGSPFLSSRVCSTALYFAWQLRRGAGCPVCVGGWPANGCDLGQPSLWLWWSRCGALCGTLHSRKPREARRGRHKWRRSSPGHHTRWHPTAGRRYPRVHSQCKRPGHGVWWSQRRRGWGPGNSLGCTRGALCVGEAVDTCGLTAGVVAGPLVCMPATLAPLPRCC